MAASGTRTVTPLAILRMFLRVGLPLIGLLVIGHAGVISVGGDIERWQFAAGALLILSGFAAKLVPVRR